MISKMNIISLKENSENPRCITDDNLLKLFESVLAFPKMLAFRPIVCNEEKIILGGNMRYRALCKILNTESEEILEVIKRQNIYMTDAEKVHLAEYWEDWKKNPTVDVVVAKGFCNEKCDEFIIKDNVCFGDWDKKKIDSFFIKDFERWGFEEKNYDISAFFDEDGKSIENEEKSAQSENLTKITIEISSEISDSKQEIIDSVTELLKDYEGVKVYE